MRLKSYLRGLGIGIIVTALLLHFSDSENLKVSKKPDNKDIDIIEVTANVLDENTDDTDIEETIKESVEVPVEETVVESEDEVSVQDEEIVGFDVSTDTKIVFDTDSNIDIEETNEPEDENEEDGELESEEVTQMLETISKTLENTEVKNEKVYEISIVKGDDSGTVSRKLANIGLIDNAQEFDAYLMQHGYDKRISVGNIKISEGATWNDIARKISGN